jgi:hypothetical protein
MAEVIVTILGAGAIAWVNYYFFFSSSKETRKR